MLRLTTLVLLLLSQSAFCMTGAQINEPVPAWRCSTKITFANGIVRYYELNTANIMTRATRTDHQWTLHGKADSNGFKLLAKIYDLNGRGEIIYYISNGEEFGRGNLHCVIRR